MNFINEYDRVKKYIIGNIAQLPAAYLLEDYNQMIQLWDGLSVTKEMDGDHNKRNTSKKHR
ncbi:MAG: hypothetical protein IPN46_14280 [Saprospiraceae bacterium]|nr:hypothetical protein [Saprospiraceae bacterium]